MDRNRRSRSYRKASPERNMAEYLRMSVWQLRASVASVASVLLCWLASTAEGVTYDRCQLARDLRYKFKLPAADISQCECCQISLIIGQWR